MARRYTLTKSTSEAIHTYSKMNTMVPKSCFKEIYKARRQFIQGDTKEDKHLHVVRCKEIEKPKKHDGSGM